jgi:outer membrane protein assembly factor BamA
VKKARYILFYLYVLVGFSGCLSLKKYPQDKYFLKRNEIDGSGYNLNREELKDVLKQKPNRKILGVLQLHLAMYNMGNAGDTAVEGHKFLGKFWKKIKRGMRTIGEEPVFLDSALTAKSVQQLTIYLQKKGYYNAVVTDSLKLHKRKAVVTYHLYPGAPYRVHSIYYSTKDEGLDTVLIRLKSTSLVRVGQNSDEDMLDKERERITADIRDHGYYFFNKNYITYEVDSALGNHEVDVYLYLNRQYENIEQAAGGEHPVENHHPYRFNSISLYTNYNTSNPNKISFKDTSYIHGVYFINDVNKQYIRTNPLSHSVFLQPGDLFLQRNVDHTYNRLADLKIFKLINFRFAEEPRSETQPNYLLNANINLSPLVRHEYKLESELTHNGGNLGVAGSFSYQDRNLLKGAESFEIKLSGGLEGLRNFADSLESKKLFFFNTFDIGPEVNIGVKRFLFPGFARRQDSSYYTPSTFFTAGFNYQERPDFRRSIVKLAYHFDQRISPFWRYQFYMPDVNSVKVNLTDAFYRKLLELHDVNLLYSYQDHLISALRISFSFNNQTPQPLKSFIYFKPSLEIAGIPFNTFNKSLQADSIGKRFVFGLRYSQYAKADIDFSYHFKVDINNTLVARTAFGYGYTYGNSKDELLPFDKAFFAGGANDIRAWQARTLGPGSYEDSLNIENGGDIKLEANLEYRSVIFKILEAALFADAGNVWIRKDVSGLLPGAQFESRKIFPQTAIGVGVGLRFNFTFFILRTDFAFKIHDPALPDTERWVYAHKPFVLFNDVVPNLAIGYPF